MRSLTLDDEQRELYQDDPDELINGIYQVLDKTTALQTKEERRAARGKLSNTVSPTN